MPISYFLSLDVPNISQEVTDFRVAHINHPGKVIPLHISIGGLSAAASEPPTREINLLQSLCTRIKPIELDLVCTCAFPSSSVLWLAPNPVGELEDLFDVLAETYNYERQWKYPTFHATIALGGGHEGIMAAEQEFKEKFSHLLPWAIRFNSISIWTEEDSHFAKHADVAFSG